MSEVANVPKVPNPRCSGPEMSWPLIPASRPDAAGMDSSIFSPQTCKGKVLRRWMNEGNCLLDFKIICFNNLMHREQGSQTQFTWWPLEVKSGLGCATSSIPQKKGFKHSKKISTTDPIFSIFKKIHSKSASLTSPYLIGNKNLFFKWKISEKHKVTIFFLWGVASVVSLHSVTLPKHSCCCHKPKLE